jgi:hypothetical protein
VLAHCKNPMENFGSNEVINVSLCFIYSFDFKDSDHLFLGCAVKLIHLDASMPKLYIIYDWIVSIARRMHCMNVFFVKTCF